jgi:hypothetical protein
MYRSVYGPDILKRMGAAFDLAWRVLSRSAEPIESTRTMLARRIILHVDRGEQDPRRLADLAMLDFVRIAHNESPSVEPTIALAGTEQVFQAVGARHAMGGWQ